MKKLLSKSEAELQIEKFFQNIKTKTPREIKKIKRFAMSYNVPLREKRKLFCGKCLKPYSGREKVRIKKKIKSVECGKCGRIGRWKL